MINLVKSILTNRLTQLTIFPSYRDHNQKLNAVDSSRSYGFLVGISHCLGRNPDFWHTVYRRFRNPVRRHFLRDLIRALEPRLGQIDYHWDNSLLAEYQVCF